jgi:hypothetical protein
VCEKKVQRGGIFSDVCFGLFGTSFSQNGEVAANALKFARRHVDNGFVFGVGNAELFGVNFHQFQFEFGDFILLCGGASGGQVRTK